MKRLLYYQPDFDRFYKVTSKWSEKCIELKYRNNSFSNVEVISFSQDGFPFKKNSGELSTYLGLYPQELASLIIVLGRSKDLPKDIGSELSTLLLYYPEVNFLFEDDTVIPDRIKADDDIVLELVCPTLRHSPDNPIDIGNISLETLLLNENLFDAANLRSAAKKWKQDLLKIENIFGGWGQRKKSLALVIDAERNQCLHNSYLLYANGYRGLPISSFEQLKSRFFSYNKIKYDLIIRDFDLQFQDESGDTYWVNIDDTSNKNPIPVSTIDFVRGFKLDRDTYRWIDLSKDNLLIYIRIPDIPYNKTTHQELPIDLPRWLNNDHKETIVFVTQGYEQLRTDTKIDSYVIRNNSLCVPGLKKPVEGIYYDFQKRSSIKQSFIDSRKHDKDPIRYRKDNDHSRPLDLYEPANALIDRATLYYNRGDYILSAVLSQEALEILNGYHMVLTIRAYHLHAISENAIVMNVIGGCEKDLAADCQFRINLIKEDIRRLTKDTEQNAQNILNQIFNDCRQYCKSKEHFQAEDVFISAMAHLNEGFSIFKPNTWHCLQRMKKLFKRSRV